MVIHTLKFLLSNLPCRSDLIFYLFGFSWFTYVTFTTASTLGGRGIVSAYHPATSDSNPKHNINAFSIQIWNVIGKGPK